MVESVLASFIVRQSWQPTKFSDHDPASLGRLCDARTSTNECLYNITRALPLSTGRHFCSSFVLHLLAFVHYPFTLQTLLLITRMRLQIALLFPSIFLLPSKFGLSMAPSDDPEYSRAYETVERAALDLRDEFCEYCLFLGPSVGQPKGSEWTTMLERLRQTDQYRFRLVNYITDKLVRGLHSMIWPE